MATRAFFISFSQPLWIEAIATLARQGKVEPVYWTAHAGAERAVRGHFPNAVFHERFKATRGIIPPECEGLEQPPLDQALLEGLALHESIVLKMMERMDMGDSFTYQERVHLYHQHLRYWLAILRHYQPQVVLFFSSPHFVYDYVLYALCQTLGIKTKFFKSTSLSGSSFAVERLESGSQALTESYQSLSQKLSDTSPEPGLSPETEAHLQALQGSYASALPGYMKDQLRREEAWKLGTLLRTCLEPKKFFERVGSVGKFIADAVSAVVSQKAAHTLIKAKGKAVRETPTVWSYGWLKVKARLKQKELKRHYERLAQNVSLETPYVFCALHMQPERTTSPDGGVFVDQYLMIELLAKSLPEGWLLYVKEHVSQLLPNIHFDSSCAQSRTTRFYDEMAALPNVRLVPLSSSSFELIDKAKAVATVTGTVGWEAVVRGKPVLAFGHPWYQGCEGVFYTPSYERTRETLAKIAAGYTLNPKKVKLFAHLIETLGFKYIYGWQQTPGLPREVLLGEFTRALESVLSLTTTEPLYDQPLASPLVASAVVV